MPAVTFTRPGGLTPHTGTRHYAASALNRRDDQLHGRASPPRSDSSPRVNSSLARIPSTCTGFTPTHADRLHVADRRGAALAANDPVYTGATTTAGTPLVGGFIKIEKQNAAGRLDRRDDGDPEPRHSRAPNQAGDPCADPTPNAVIRLQRLRDNGLPAGACAAAGHQLQQRHSTATDFGPTRSSTRAKAVRDLARGQPLPA